MSLLQKAKTPKNTNHLPLVFVTLRLANSCALRIDANATQRALHRNNNTQQHHKHTKRALKTQTQTLNNAKTKQTKQNTIDLQERCVCAQAVDLAGVVALSETLDRDLLQHFRDPNRVDVERRCERRSLFFVVANCFVVRVVIHNSTQKRTPNNHLEMSDSGNNKHVKRRFVIAWLLLL